MKHFLALLFLVYSPFFIFAQCPSGNLTFDTQDQIDDFAILYAGCTDFDGSIYIGESSPGNIISLAGLTGLESISGDLFIEYNTKLPHLSGLNQLKSVGGAVYIGFNKALSSLSGLDNLSTIGGFLDIWTNPSLTSLTGLGDLVFINGSLFIGFNNALTDVFGLEKLAFVGGNFDLGNNAVLTNLTSLKKLKAIEGCLNIYNNSSLNTLSGLDNIDPTTITDLEIISSNNLAHCEVMSICDYIGLGGTATISSNATGCNSIEEVLGACAFVLPVELVHFAYYLEEGSVVLAWLTSTEQDNLGFEIEKSRNGSLWETIGFVEGKGTTDQGHAYAFQDHHPVYGESYYRLKQFDYNGQFVLSKVLVVRNDALGIKVKSYPNPSKEVVNFVINSPDATRMNIQLTDNLGNLIWDSGLIEKTDYWTKEFQIQKSGVYLLRAHVGKNVINRKIVILDDL